jgi:hypothetical protein
MPKIYVKESGVWKQVQRLWTKTGGVWSSPIAALITQGGVGKQFYPDSIGPTTYNSAGTYTYTVPATVTSLSISATGGGGAGQVSYFDGGSWYQQNGAAGGTTTVTEVLQASIPFV